MVKIQQDKNGNGYFYLVKNTTTVAGSFEHTVVLRAVLSCSITLKPLPKQKIGFLQLYWFSYRKTSFRNMTFFYLQTSQDQPRSQQTISTALLDSRLVFMLSYRGLTERSANLCCVSTTLCCVSMILCCVSVILCCVSTTLCCVSIILCCVSVILCCFVNFVLCFHNFVLCFNNFVLCFHNFVLCFDNFVLCFDNFVLCFTKLTCVSKTLCCVSRIVCCVCRCGPPYFLDYKMGKSDF